MVCIFTSSFISWFNSDFADAKEHMSVVLNLKQRKYEICCVYRQRSQKGLKGS